MNNPFFYIEANRLNSEELVKYFIDENNHNDFIQSTKNIFLIGERGSGKSMILIYNSYTVQKSIKGNKIQKSDSFNIGIYVQITPSLFEKRESELQDIPIKQVLLSEHYLVLIISLKLISALNENFFLEISKEDLLKFRRKLSSIFDISIPDEDNPFEGLYDNLKRQQIKTQEKLLHIDENFPEATLSFFSFLLPLIDTIKMLNFFQKAHFNFLIDDAQNLNDYQKKLLSSWVAYRDHADYSLKISITRPEEYLFQTTNGSPILEGHDYVARYTEGRFQNQFSDFGQLAKKIIKRRIDLLEIGDIQPEDFFITDKNFTKDIEECKKIVRKRGIEKYGHDQMKKVDDYVYKYARSEYFRNKDPNANKAPYSGFEIITHLSTGVIRNLLEPCSLMFDMAKDRYNISEKRNIDSNIQEVIIDQLCQQKWSNIKDKMPTSVTGCTISKSNYIYNLLERIGDLFRKRLLDLHASEPRAISFTISAFTDLLFQEQEELLDLLRISRSYGLIFKRLSAAKEAGKFEVYYTPHRMLWPIKGLDPVGQHARVSIKAKALYDAAIRNKEIIYNTREMEDESNSVLIQKSLFSQF